jgi:hypothetical protein
MLSTIIAISSLLLYVLKTVDALDISTLGLLPQILHLRLHLLQLPSQPLHHELVGVSSKNQGILHSLQHLNCSEKHSTLRSGGVVFVSGFDNVVIDLSTEVGLDSML